MAGGERGKERSAFRAGFIAQVLFELVFTEKGWKSGPVGENSPGGE